MRRPQNPRLEMTKSFILNGLGRVFSKGRLRMGRDWRRFRGEFGRRAGRLPGGGLKMAHEPGAGEVPVAADGAGRGVQGAGGFLLGEAAEVAQFDDFGLAGRGLREGFQGLIEGEEELVGFGGRMVGVVEGDDAGGAAAFKRGVAAGGVDQDVADEARDEGEKLGAVLPIDGAEVEQPEVDLINEGGGFQAVGIAFVAAVAAGDAAEFGQQAIGEAVERAIVSGSPGTQQNCDL